MTFTNPIIRGFNPDPSIIKVEDDYYIACSTFEWFPGVQIHHSTDLKNWKLITRPLDNPQYFNLRGVPDSCGVWAPCLSYDNGTYYLVYSIVKSFDGIWKNTPNYLITAKSIYGPWSEPVFLSAIGFDGSLFHDGDGRKYFLSMIVDHRENRFFGGIYLQEFDTHSNMLIGKGRKIVDGSHLGKTEGPHLYFRDGYYYLLLAEGGTEYGHAVSICRAKDIWGPYTFYRDNPILSSADYPDHFIQKTGHGDIVWDDDGNCFMVFLGSRPLSVRGHCVLGRETCIDQLVWNKNEWPRLANKSTLISENQSDYYNLVEQEVKLRNTPLPIDYQSLRVPQSDDWIKHELDKGLTLIGRDSLTSCFDQSFVARRVQNLIVQFSVDMYFTPENYHQMAGLVCYYNTGHHYYLYTSYDESKGKYIQLIRTDNYNTTELAEYSLPKNENKLIRLRVQLNYDSLIFFYQTDDGYWEQIGSDYDSAILSDDYVREGSDKYRPAFTGCFVGIACQDLRGNKKEAVFTGLHYKELAFT